MTNYEKTMGQPCCFTTKASNDRKMMLIEITNRCNLNCNYCHSVPNTGGELKLSDERLLRLLDECKDESFRSLIISGGEPLLSKRVFTVAAAAQKLGLKTDLCTNGTILNDEIRENIKRYFDGITVTLDTNEPSVYALMKGCTPQLFFKVVKNIESLTKADVKVGVTVVLTKHNVIYIQDVLRFLEDIGVRKVALLRLYNFTPEAHEFDILYSKELITNTRACIESFPKMDVKFKGFDFYAYKTAMCGAGRSIFAVEHGGHLLPCILMRNYSPDCDLSQVTLRQALHSAAIKNIVSDIEKMQACDCIYNSQCAKGCPCTTYEEEKLVVPDIRCMQRIENKSW